MSDEKALLAAIWEHPHEEVPRLVYADWLQENGTPADVARAEFIRLQCTAAALDEDESGFRTARAAANKLLKRWGRTWKEGLPRRIRGEPWHRGFLQPDDCGIYFDELLRMPVADLRAVPTRLFCVMDAARRFDELLAFSHLDRLCTFYLREGVPSGDWVSRALACRGFRNVNRICLNTCPVQVAQVEALLTAWHDHRIGEILLPGTKVGDDGLRMLLHHRVLKDVRELGLYGIDLSSAGVRALAGSSYRPRVPHLTLGGNPIGDAGIEELIRWPGLARTRVLGLSGTRLTDAGAIALAGCKALRSLRKLWLADNGIGEAGALALADSPHLRNLTELYLHNNPILDDSVQRLHDRFGAALKSPRA